MSNFTDCQNWECKLGTLNEHERAQGHVLCHRCREKKRIEAEKLHQSNVFHRANNRVMK